MITLQNGEIIFVDLARQATLAPYRIPNVWKTHEERLTRSGLSLDDKPPRNGPYVSFYPFCVPLIRRGS
jgi:hypothetical protein